MLNKNINRHMAYHYLFKVLIIFTQDIYTGHRRNIVLCGYIIIHYLFIYCIFVICDAGGDSVARTERLLFSTKK